ncbi:MAG: hypothetical protein CM15mV31_1080 [uncultured marine virus]|nr:MAG: hypothetical protein CM15mV31_1080 [uncultured marine virus]
MEGFREKEFQKVKEKAPGVQTIHLNDGKGYTLKPILGKKQRGKTYLLEKEKKMKCCKPKVHPMGKSFDDDLKNPYKINLNLVWIFPNLGEF